MNIYAQNEVDSIYISPRKLKLINDPLTPSKAAFYSSIIPGLGQVYTRRYWMVPIIYGGLGASAYYYNFNNKEMVRCIEKLIYDDFSMAKNFN